ncbi:MAG: hypothetical protein H7062_24950 [Candidatus Saccharimonas sp.]|nr:hypothetical protein [Planctomycetaceae bacterium]
MPEVSLVARAAPRVVEYRIAFTGTRGRERTLCGFPKSDLSFQQWARQLGELDEGMG